MKLTATNTTIVKRLLVGRNSKPLRSILRKMEAADIASLLRSLNSRETRLLLSSLLSVRKAADVLVHIPESQLVEILHDLESFQITQLVNDSSLDDAAYFLSLLEKDRQDELLRELDEARREKIRLYLSYPEDSAGRLMQTQVFSLSANLIAQDGLDELRKRAQEESIYYIYCVNEDRQLVGICSLRQLATAPANKLLSDIMKREVISVSPDTSSDEVARLASHYDFIALPVVDQGHHLLGIITIDDVVDIIQQQATADLYAHAGLQQDDRVYTPVRVSVKNRLPWMALNLILAALASSVISLFESTMSELIILASLNNIVAAMGGNTAIQTLTVVTRGLATGDFNFISISRAVMKETLVGLSIGLMTGLGAAFLIYFWKGSPLVAVVIFLSMILNALLASTAGALVPILIKRFNGDPATGSGVLVTMMTDIFGFFSFLGIATLGLRLVS